MHPGPMSDELKPMPAQLLTRLRKALEEEARARGAFDTAKRVLRLERNRALIKAEANGEIDDDEFRSRILYEVDNSVNSDAAIVALEQEYEQARIDVILRSAKRASKMPCDSSSWRGAGDADANPAGRSHPCVSAHRTMRSAHRRHLRADAKTSLSWLEGCTCSGTWNTSISNS